MSRIEDLIPMLHNLTDRDGDGDIDSIDADAYYRYLITEYTKGIDDNLNKPVVASYVENRNDDGQLNTDDTVYIPEDTNQDGVINRDDTLMDQNASVNRLHELDDLILFVNSELALHTREAGEAKRKGDNEGAASIARKVQYFSQFLTLSQNMHQVETDYNSNILQYL